jgi:hypothetical protein
MHANGGIDGDSRPRKRYLETTNVILSTKAEGTGIVETLGVKTAGPRGDWGVLDHATGIIDVIHGCPNAGHEEEEPSCGMQ